MVETRSDADPEVHGKVQRMAVATVVLTAALAVLVLALDLPWVSTVVGLVAIAVAMTAQLMSTTTRQRFIVIIAAVVAGTLLMYEAQHIL